MSESGFPLRRLLAIQLHDTAPVVDPAYLDTSTGLRSLAEHRGVDVAEVEQLAQANRLAELIHRSKPIVIDSKTTPPEGRQDDKPGQVDNHPGTSVLDARRALEGRRVA